MPFEPLIKPGKRGGFTPDRTAPAARPAFEARATAPGAPQHAPEEPPPTSEPEPVDLDALVAEAKALGAAEERTQLQAEAGEVLRQAQAVTQAAAQLEGLRELLVREALADVAAITLALVERVLRDSVALHPGALPQLLEGALDRFPERDHLVVRAPADRAEGLAELLGPTLRVEADPTLRDGVVVTSQHGSVEATVDAVLDGVREAVAAWVEAQS